MMNLFPPFSWSYPRGVIFSQKGTRNRINKRTMNMTIPTNRMMSALVKNAHVISLANWTWGGGPSDSSTSNSTMVVINPTLCLESLPFLPSSCLSPLIAKVVGMCIVLASCVNKAPVINNIIKSNSVSGLSSTSIYGEIILYSNASLYNILRGNPFSAYGETFTVLLQTMIVAVLFWRYHYDDDDDEVGSNAKSSNRGRRRRKDVAFALAGYCAYLFVVFYGECVCERERERARYVAA